MDGGACKAACSPWGCWGLDTTERLHFHFSLSCIGERNGNPLQCSCLENPRDGGWAAIYGVTQSATWLTQLSSSRNKHCGPTMERVIRVGQSRKWLLPHRFNYNMNMWKLFLHFFWSLKVLLLYNGRVQGTLREMLHKWKKCFHLRPSVPVRETRDGDFWLCAITEWRNPTMVMTVREPSLCPVHVDISRLVSDDPLQSPVFREIMWLRDSSAQRLSCYFPVPHRRSWKWEQWRGCLLREWLVENHCLL